MMAVPDEGTFSVRAEPAAAAKPTAATGPPRDGSRWLLPAGALLLVVVLGVYVADLVTHLSYMTAMRDLVVYRDGGLIARHIAPAYDGHRASPLYDWTGPNGVQFTYPPFAAAVFAVASVLPWTVLRWAMTLASLAALGLSAWLTFGALGYRDRPKVRLGATFGVSALALLTEPVQQTLSLGQVNLLLMLLVVADLLTSGGRAVPGARTRWWHGTGIGIAAGIKLTPLIFIPYLLLVRKFRQAATATATFAATVALGYAILPRDSDDYWADRLFLNANRIVFLGTRGNQSLRGVMTRLAGSVTSGTAPWIAAAALVVIVGLITAAVLYRVGHPVPAMGACALTGLLVSPLTWDHHWVWVTLGIALLAHLGAQARGRVRAAWWVAAAALLAVFGAWPQFWDARAGLPPAGLFWYGPATYFATGDKPWYHEFHWHGLQVLAGNIFVLAGVAALAALAVSALRLWLRARNTANPGEP